MSEVDAKTTWVRKAAEAYNCGQYGECEKCLQEALSHIEAFSRLRWGVESNQLACKLQRAVGRTDELEEICSGYALLWEKTIGLPPNADSVPTEVAIVCAMCQLAMTLEAQSNVTTKFTLKWSAQHCSTLVSRICNYFGVEENPIGQVLPALIQSLTDSVVNEDAFAVKGILKVMFLRAMMYLIHDEREEGVKMFSSVWASLNRQPENGGDLEVFDAAIQTKRLVEETLTSEDAVVTVSSEHECKYNEAWLLFNREEYHLALDTLHTLLHTSSLPDVISSVARLLAGGCYANVRKPNLALCSYQQCLRSSSNVAVVPALHSSASVYRTMGNAEAEMGMRKILLEALKLQEEHKNTHEKPPGVVVWSHGLGGKNVSLHPAVPSGLELLHAIYTSAYRAKQLHRYKESAASFMEIIRILESGCKALPPSVPSPSTLYLLTIRAMLCSAEYEQANLLCSKLVDTFLPRAESWLSAPNPNSTQTNTTATVGHVLVLAQALYFRSIATVYLNKVQESRVYCERCLNLINFMLLRLTEGDQLQMLNCVKSVQAHALNHLAVLSIGQRKNNHALRLLTEALASSAPAPKPTDNLGMESDSNTSGTAGKENPPSTSNVPSSSCLPLVFNHCLLQCKLGKVVDAAHGWLEERGGLPTTVREGRQGLAETLAGLKREGKEHYTAVMDAAMLGVWLRHANR